MAIHTQASLPNRDMLVAKAEQLVGRTLPIGVRPVSAAEGIRVVAGVSYNLWANSDAPPGTVLSGAKHISGLLGRYRSDALRTMDVDDLRGQLLGSTPTGQLRLVIGEIINRTGDYMAGGFLSDGIRRPRINGFDCFVSAGARSQGSSLEIPLSMLREAVRTFPEDTNVSPDGSGPISMYDYLSRTVAEQ